MDSSSARRGSKKHMVTARQPGLKSRLDAGFQIGDRVILIAGTLASNAETALQEKAAKSLSAATMAGLPSVLTMADLLWAERLRPSSALRAKC
jgi:hypothetical protein